MSPLFERERSRSPSPPPRAPGRYGNAGALVNVTAVFRAVGTITLLLFVILSGQPRAADAAPRILAFGDSLVAGFGLSSPSQSFPARLQAQLAGAGLAAEVVNGGISGDTSAGGLARLDWALAGHPDLVLLELGANDALRGIDPKLTYDNLDKILAHLQETGTKVLLIGMRAPANWGRDYQIDFDAIYPKLAAKYRVPLYPFFLEGVALDPALNQGDGLHPNARGVDVIVARIAPSVTRALAGKGSEG